ncbi:MAG TPA: glycosyltransferase, partial [Thermoanaerobaculia bacterium]|nr:glycosyltransferase [Thermoanaerobaculia bacterium]
YYRGLAESLGIADRVDFLGFVPHAALADFFRACHIVVLPSTDGRQEGFGLVLLEAMSCARPVLTTPVVGMAGDIDRARAGVLMPPGDSKALAEALAGLLADGPALAAMGERGRRLVEERYTWGRVTEAYEGLFEELRRSRAASQPRVETLG